MTKTYKNSIYGVKIIRNESSMEHIYRKLPQIGKLFYKLFHFSIPFYPKWILIKLVY